MRLRVRRALLAVALFALPSAANWNDTPTGLDLKKLRQFPLTKLHSGLLKAGASFSFDGIAALVGSGSLPDVRLRGSAKSGKKWLVDLFALDEVWRGDLDGNGTQDYVFFAGGPYFNGSSIPLYSLSFLLMDADRLPVPVFTTVYFGENGDGIRHVVDLDGDHHAELLISDYDENASDPRVPVLWSGHWVHQLYRFRNFGLEVAKGIHGGISFPRVHNWSYRTTERMDVPSPMPTEPARMYEYQTSAAGAHTTLREVGANGELKVDPVAGCETVTAALTVFDRPKLREIAFPKQFDDTFAEELRRNILRAGASVELRGVTKLDSSGDCSVALLWATER